ncbi:MAG TPA: FG-GAP-like repeat-containing protein [Bryobacteraceae bacterium]|nr:FG-GAP-like repeat-containing protein [Bryobacteraceae bacterium]
MKAIAAILLGTAGAIQALAQPVCPPVNFEQLAQVKLQNRPQNIVSGMLRQADQSFSQYEVTGNFQTRTASEVGIVPDIQLSFFPCSGLAARNPLPGPAPNRSIDPLGTASRNTIITDLAGDGVGAIVGLDQQAAPGQVVVVTASPDFTVTYAGGYTVGTTPLGVVAGDFNGDGRHDVAVVYFGPVDNSTPGGISVLLGTGAGALQPAVNYPAGRGTIAATAWDFNGDGKTDLAVANSVDSTVTIMLGSANGRLTIGNTYSAGIGSAPTSIGVADVNGDGIADVVVSTALGIATLLGNGDGTFKYGPITKILTSQSIMALGDFNKDGKMDVAVTDYESGLVSILLGNGDGTFRPLSQYLIGYAPPSFYVLDLDGDGNPDIVFAAGHPDALITLPYTQTVGVLFGNGDGTFAGVPAYPLSIQPSTMGIAAADFNGDGRPDLALGADGQISILIGNGGSKFQTGLNLSAPNGNSVRSGVAAGDLNGDGKIDLAINDGQSGATIFLGNGDGTFEAPRPVAGGGTGTSYVAMGDFNNDHNLDLAIANQTSNNVTVAPGNGNGTFGAGATFTVGSNPTVLLTGDFNRDGNLDLAVVDYGTLGSSSDPGGLSILLGKGDGAFQNAVNYSASMNPNSIGAGDVNNDGITDLIVTAGAPNFNYTLVVFIGNGDGTFKPGVLIPTAFGPEKVAIADFSGDGKPDLVVPHCCGDTEITYLLGNGDGTFQPEVPITYASAINSVVADFNKDGKPDIAFAGQGLGGGTASAFIFLNAPLTAPRPLVSGVIGASSFGAFADIASGSWIEIYGSNLAVDTRDWTGSDFSGPDAPTSLDGTSVEVDGKAAFVYYISPGQVDALVPGGVTPGTAQVEVTVGAGVGASYPVPLLSTEPGMLAPANFNVEGTQYVVAQLPDGAYVLPAGAIAGLTSRPAMPGETIVIYGIGFGPTENSAQQVSPVGQIASGLTELTANFAAFFGQTQATVAYAGLAPGYVGLYQFNVIVPTVADSNAVPFTFTLGGASGGQTLYTAVHQ